MSAFNIIVLGFLFNTLIYFIIGLLVYVSYKKENDKKRKEDNKVSDDSTTRNN